MLEAAEVCETMMRRIAGGTLILRLHSAFDRALNFSSELGMITLLAPGRCVMPYSVVLRDKTDFHSFPKGSDYSLNLNGVLFSGRKIICFDRAEREDLRLPEDSFSEPFEKEKALEAIRSFLSEHISRGLTELALDRYESIYARFLAPRLKRLRMAGRNRSGEALTQAAFDAAGCGEGLTPSSDDLLCGYLLCATARFMRSEVQKAAYKASERTNDISAALLKRAGDGLFSKDVLTLAGCLYRGGSAEDTQTALERVAAFGSSSGCDFLTGLYFGIQDFTEGKEAMLH